MAAHLAAANPHPALLQVKSKDDHHNRGDCKECQNKRFMKLKAGFYKTFTRDEKKDDR